VNRILLAIAANGQAQPCGAGRIESIARERQVERSLDEPPVILEADIAAEAQAGPTIDHIVGDGGPGDTTHNPVADTAPARPQLRDEVLVGKIVDQHVTTLGPGREGLQGE
jgi:hypothetical protein